MSELITIGKGAEAKSDTLNSNFQCLDEKIISANQRIETVSASIKSVQSTLNSQLNSNILTTLETIYPIGSLYVGTTDNCPIANLFGTWEKVSEGRVLQGANGNQEAGTTVEAGLPNITGRIYSAGYGSTSGYGNINKAEGAFAKGSISNGSGGAADSYAGNSSPYADFNASRSNSIYGKSSTVQPPAYLVNIWKRTA